MIKEALDSGISLTLSSAKANSLLTQVHRELEAEDHERERLAEADRRRDELAESHQKAETKEATQTSEGADNGGRGSEDEAYKWQPSTNGEGASKQDVVRIIKTFGTNGQMGMRANKISAMLGQPHKIEKMVDFEGKPSELWTWIEKNGGKHGAFLILGFTNGVLITADSGPKE